MTFRIDCRNKGEKVWTISREVWKYRRGRDLKCLAPKPTLARLRLLHPNYEFRIVRLGSRRLETKPEPI